MYTSSCYCIYTENGDVVTLTLLWPLCIHFIWGRTLRRSLGVSNSSLSWVVGRWGWGCPRVDTRTHWRCPVAPSWQRSGHGFPGWSGWLLPRQRSWWCPLQGSWTPLLVPCSAARCHKHNTRLKLKYKIKILVWFIESTLSWCDPNSRFYNM